MAISVDELIAILRRTAAQVPSFAPTLNELDGKLGDGDLGATLEKCAANIATALDAPAGTVDAVFKACAMACARASGSSFGTLLGVAFLTCAKQTAGQTEIAPDQLARLLESVLAALIARGGAALGDKTVLDPIAAVREAIAGESGRDAQFDAAARAVRDTLDTYRGKPNRIGRARMFAERSVGMDDPGMVAFGYLLHAAGGQVFEHGEMQHGGRA